MKKNRFSELTTLELNKQKSSLNNILIAAAVLLVILCGIILYPSDKSQNVKLLTILPYFLLGILPGAIRWSQINTELKSRQ